MLHRFASHISLRRIATTSRNTNKTNLNKAFPEHENFCAFETRLCESYCKVNLVDRPFPLDFIDIQFLPDARLSRRLNTETFLFDVNFPAQHFRSVNLNC